MPPRPLLLPLYPTNPADADRSPADSWLGPPCIPPSYRLRCNQEPLHSPEFFAEPTPEPNSSSTSRRPPSSLRTTPALPPHRCVPRRTTYLPLALHLEA